MNYYPNSHVEKSKPQSLTGRFYVYAFLPKAPFYRSLTTYRDFVVSPLNLIPQILLEIDDDQVGYYQLTIKPLGGVVHSMISKGKHCRNLE